MLKLIPKVIQVIYCFFKAFSKKCKVVYISRQSDNISLDFSLLYKKIGELAPDVQQVVLAKKLEGGMINKIRYCFHVLQQMYHISTSKVVVLDGYCIAASVLHHKKGTTIIQIWHALGAIKKFGYQALDTSEGSSSSLAEAMHMHANYNYVFCASRETAKLFAEAFNTPLENFEILGMPRVDYILENPDRNDEILSAHPEYAGKKTILYIPTFRKKETLNLEPLINAVDTSRYNLIIKPHPLDTTVVAPQFLMELKYGTYDLMKFADYIITDYSATSLEASLLGKPVFFYLYDYETYVDARGLNIDPFREMPGASSRDIKTIVEIIENDSYDYKELQNFRSKYVETSGFSNTERIAQQIISLTNS